MNMKKWIYIFCAAGLLTACTDDVMDRLNRNENDPEDVPSRYLFTDAETSSAVNLVSGDFAFYTAVYMEQQAGIFNQMYNAEMRLADVYSAATFNNAWGSTYRNLRALKIIRERCATGGVESGSNHLLGMAQVLTALNLATLTDLMGDIPWSEALQPGVVYQPKLDSQESIYQNIFSLLDDAIANLKSDDLATLTPVGHQDLIYGQYDTDRQAELWIKAAYGLKARYTLRLSYREPRYDRVIDYADSAFVDAGEQLAYPYDGRTSINPFYAFYLNRRYFGASESLHQKLVERNDPREALFFKAYPGTGKLVFAPNGSPEQRQGYYGISGLLSPTRPTLLLSYHELQFVKAEAQTRLGLTGDAIGSLYNAVVAAFAQVGLSASEANDYFQNVVLPRFEADPIGEIINQKYLACYEGEVLETYHDYRRLQALGEADVLSLDNPLPFPLRLPYGNSDVVSNEHVAQAYGNGDYVTTEPVWWAGGNR